MSASRNVHGISYRRPPPPPVDLSASHEVCICFEYCVAVRPSDTLKGSTAKYVERFETLAHADLIKYKAQLRIELKL